MAAKGSRIDFMFLAPPLTRPLDPLLYTLLHDSRITRHVNENILQCMRDTPRSVYKDFKTSVTCWETSVLIFNVKSNSVSKSAAFYEPMSVVRPFVAPIFTHPPSPSSCARVYQLWQHELWGISAAPPSPTLALHLRVYQLWQHELWGISAAPPSPTLALHLRVYQLWQHELWGISAAPMSVMRRLRCAQFSQ